MTGRQLRRRAYRHPALAAAVAVIAVLVLGAVVREAFGLVILAAVAAVAFYAGRRSRRPRRASARVTAPANARSLAQLNRHLNEQLDTLQAKLEAEMSRADRAEESARAARDAADGALAHRW